MRFGRVLHPEVLLGRRGNPDEIFLMTKVMDMTTIDPVNGGIVWECDRHDRLGYNIGKALEIDNVFMRWTVSCKSFIETPNAVTYHVGSEFLQALQKIDRTLPVDIIPERFCGYFSFARQTVYDDTDEIEGGYVCVGRGKDLGMKAEFADMRVITFAYNCRQTKENSNNNFTSLPPVGSMTIPLDAKTIDELAGHVPAQDFFMIKPVNADQASQERRNVVFRTLLNCLIYIHSTEPIIERSVPLADSKKTIKEHKKLGHIINACTIPVHFLYPQYKLPKVFKVNSTWVDSHPRWQRCGPGFTSVKLVFVRAHERRFDTSSSEQVLTT